MIRNLAEIAAVIARGALAFAAAIVTLALLGTGIPPRIFAITLAVALVLAEPDGFAGPVRRWRGSA
jgi:hypothetical protein